MKAIHNYVLSAISVSLVVNKNKCTKIESYSQLPNQHILSNFMKNRSYRKYPSCLISLGCGDGRQEKLLLKELEENYPDIKYFGIDSSKEMLLLAEKNLQNISLQKEFIQADYIFAKK